MKFVENWEAILKGAWSVRLAAVASALISASESASSVVPTGIFGITPELVADAALVLRYLGYATYAAGAFVARFMDQGIAVAQIQAALDAAKERS
ncbi:hypothetical protein SAMN05216428_11412 [Nitrosospira sp. Nsp11]|uniref:DUF7940 domain-containing protein n=1 Tax=Nitrosospira sp. Nsp11 TaxID=1855338 RepID=UPI000916E105|nr:hypothetical protein [Nitrosospira sp. Nsp11]SHM10932.1 hypothetical protein SAMN05216428_11412 [Nitrosospira sp. Nsp11]